VLCGVEVDHPQGLAGHSDADVAVHALIDALLGAAGAGDIGELFPDSDEAYRDVSSMRLLRLVMERLAWDGWAVENADVTIVCEQPRIGPYRQAMRARLATQLDVDVDAVGVKGTTTEGMGYEGRGEGISATAVCLLSRGG
jgi:2-C-methyl-D-erythritol 4-phosphate cytidylyltransferase/2-C-methyl-D-erythritol 2,4-cyclodiphosphate synthase